MTNVRDYGARGDGQTDDTSAINHAIQSGDGYLVLPRGDYRISRPLHVPLQLHGRLGIDGQGGTARLLMSGPGPALHLVGSHRRSAQPDTFAEEVWRKERLPMVRDLEIVGQHPQADGIRVEGAMQPTLQGVLIRHCRHGIHLANRDRNVLIADCHIYDNHGIGIFLDRLNLHQVIIHGCHISYCKQGGIRISGSEIRNIQICSNDIEYNYDRKAETSSDVLLDCREGTVREGTLIGNTIQAVESPGGANVRLLGAASHPNAVGLFTITGNLIGSQETAIELRSCRGVVVSGNSIFSGYQHALRVEDADCIVIGANSIDHNPEYRGNSTDRVVIRNSRNVTLTGLIQQHTKEASKPVFESMEIRGCQQINVTGCQIIQARGRGIVVSDSSLVRIADCTIPASRWNFRSALAVEGKCSHLMVVNNFLGQGLDGVFQLPAEMGTSSGNVTVK